MHNKKICDLKDIPGNMTENILIADENKPSVELKNRNLKWSMLVRLSMKDGRIHDCVFRHCIFQDCYLRNVRFRNVNLTGSFFKDCNLSKATFEACCFWYVRFSKCWLNYDEILQSIPPETSIALPFLRSLRQNAIEMGEKKIADKVLLREIGIEKQELKNQFCAKTKYYKSRFNTIERLFGGLRFLGLQISGLIWGYGLKLLNLVASALLAMIVFAIFIFKFGPFVRDGGSAHIDLNFAQSLYLSVITFTTLGYGDFTPSSAASYVICATESCIGFIFLGFLAASVYRRFAK